VAKNVVVIGSGFAGLSAACFMAKAGWKVQVVEKNSTPGGRARKFEAEGFTFDMGPSWYWMPGVFERFFNKFGKNVCDYYALKRLDPSYKVFWPDDATEIPADYIELKKLFNKLEPGSGENLDAFLSEAEYKYEVGINKLVLKPGRSLLEFADIDLIKGLFKLDVFTSMKKHVAKYFKSQKLRELMEFPVLFLGALPEDTPALYSLMNYADIKGGTWYPEGGMFSIVDAMFNVAKELGVEFFFNEDVKKIEVENSAATKVVTTENEFKGDVIIAGADYHHVETALLTEEYRSYSKDYWEKRVLAPGCLLYYVGLNKRLKNINHHTLFFDVPFEAHGREIYKTKEWPKEPLFYLSATSVTDNNVAPEGCENLFFLIPVAAGLQNDNEELREKYFDMIVKRMEQRIRQSIKDSIIFKKTFAHSDFVNEYNAFKGNAYGLANTLLQTAILKPSIRSKRVKNLFYTGQLTVPGPGVPPSLISGEVVAAEVIKYYA
jgi:phytoene desaturase